VSGLPKGWKQEALGDIIRLRGDKRPPGMTPESIFVGLEDVEPHTSRVLRYGRAGDMKSAAASFSSGEILYSRLRPYLNKVFVADRDGLASAEFLVLKPSEMTDPDFVRRRIMMDDFLAFTASLDKGDRPRVDFKQIAQFSLQVPPLPEQRRILAKLDSLTDRTARAREELGNLPRLIQKYREAILAAAFSGELTRDWRNQLSRHLGSSQPKLGLVEESSLTQGKWNLPEGWSWVTAGSLCEIKGGITLGKKYPETARLVTRPYLRVANVQRGWLNLDEIKTIKVAPHEAEKLALQSGDILMNEGGDRDKLGRGWIWENQIADCIHQNHVFRLRVRTASVPPRYISLYANAFGQQYFIDEGKQTTNLASVSMKKVAALPIPVACADEMLEVVRRIETAFDWLDRVTAEHTNASRLLPKLDQAMLTKAFRGELVPQDPNDKPVELSAPTAAEGHDHRGRSTRKVAAAPPQGGDHSRDKRKQRRGQF
jgi:type I restriction enzyme S subunit